MTVKQQKNGSWLCHIDKKGFKRIRRVFADESDANIFNRETLASMNAKRDQITDSRTLRELINLWYKYHGVNLSDNVRTKSILDTMANAMGNPKASALSAEHFVDYRFERINNGLSAKTFNNHHGYLSAMFNKLKKLKVIDYDNPIEGIEFIKLQQRQLTYLSVDQINTLMDDIQHHCVNKSTWYVAQLCVRTGARWGEAERLLRQQLHTNRVTFVKTKSKKLRTVPLDPVFYKKLISFVGNKNPSERVFTNCIGAFRRAVKRTGIELPPGQNSHILRHSFASHFVINGGNILTLQKILGHADIHTTLKYAHLAPDHLQDAILYGPLHD